MRKIRVLTEKEIKSLAFYSGRGLRLAHVCRKLQISYHTAYSHISRNNLSYIGLATNWTEEMLERLLKEFPVRFNKELAKDLKVGWRTVVRKARELGIDKEPGFLDKRRVEITEMVAIAKENKPDWYVPHKESKGFIANRFKKGERQGDKQIAKAVASRNKTIKSERARIALGLPQETKIRLI